MNEFEKEMSSQKSMYEHQLNEFRKRVQELEIDLHKQKSEVFYEKQVDAEVKNVRKELADMEEQNMELQQQLSSLQNCQNMDDRKEQEVSIMKQN